MSNTINKNYNTVTYASFFKNEPSSLILTENNVYDIAKNIVINGLKRMSSNELAEILCNNLILEIDDNDKYKNLLRLTNNNYLYVLKCILEGKKCQM